MATLPYIIATSKRNDCNRQYFETISLNVLEEKTAYEFLIQELKLSQVENYKKLLTLLEYHPLAIQQAVSYIIVNSVTID